MDLVCGAICQSIQGVGPDLSRPAAQSALNTAILNGIEDPELKIEFLRSEVAGNDSWAAEELCDRGALVALPEIRRLFRRLWSGSYGEDQAQFCEARMQVVSRDPDRVKALASALDSILRLEHTVEGKRLLKSAISRLAAMHSPEADTALDQFAVNLGTLLRGDPEEPNRSFFKNEVNRVQAIREK